MTGPQLYVICYDISDDRRRLRVASILERLAVRVQASVFEWRATENAAEALSATLKAHIKIGDSLRIYVVPDKALANCRAIGGAPMAEPGNYFLF